MTTPQNPGDSDSGGPQDPQDPQNPYGAPPPPPSTPPAPTPEAPQPGAIPPPTHAPYGDPSTPPPPHGDPAAPPAYGQPAYGQPTYGQPGFPQYGAPPPSNAAGKGLAITALVLSFLACTIVLAIPAIIMAIVVLVQSRDGRNHGKGLAIAALVISGISVIGTVAGGAALYNWAKDFKGPNDLTAGECITAKGLSDADADSVTEIKTVACSSKHDGEVLAVHELTAEEAAGSDSQDVCRAEIVAAGKAAVLTPDVTYTALTVADPGAGDHAACVAYRVDGSQLTGALGS